MKYDIVTIFPDFFNSIFSSGIIRKAIEGQKIEIKIHNLRNFTSDKHRIVDDKPYGGGSGMLLKPEPITKAVESIKNKEQKNTVILTSPQGQLFNNKLAQELASYEQIIIVCGRYEGIDERVKELCIDREISVGDYILSGGEYAASILVDCISRFVPGVVGKTESVSGDSFQHSLLKYPQYTRPEEYKGKKVPQILLSGNHSKIEKWRRLKALEKTYRNRPDLLDSYVYSEDEYNFMLELQEKNSPSYNVYIALLHYPVYNKQRKIIASAFTNLDMHDLARASETYGIKKFFLVNPVKEQQQLAQTVLDHWLRGEGSHFNPTRKRALKKVQIIPSLDETLLEIKKTEGKFPKIVSTDAKFSENMVGYNELRKEILSTGDPFLIIFGTGWGISEAVMSKSDYILKPVKGYSRFNHLSVRSAASIILDRLFSCNI